MNELKKITTCLKDNIGQILLLVYTVSFVNYYIFFKSFNISIFNYLVLYDLIFFTLEYLFQILLIIVIYELIFFLIFSILWGFYEKIVLISKKKLKLYLNSDKMNRERILDVFNEYFSKGLINAKFTIVLLGIFGIFFLPFKLITIPAYLIYIIYLTELISKERMYGFSVTFASIILILSMIFTTLFNSYSKRFEKENYTISFKEENQIITTEKGKSSLNYLGETSTNIFLYDIKSKKAKIYNKSSISDFEIQNSDTLDNYILLVKESYPVRKFMEMINEK
jgi:hypothetical protein